MNRKWCLTVNTNAREFYDELEELYNEHSTKIQYICGQLEEATTGQVHFQGYCQLKRTQRMSWMKNHINDGAHYEKQRGTNCQAREYCMKEETSLEDFIEFGRFIQGQGTRSDLTTFKVAILSGKRKIDILDQFINEMARYPKFYSMVRALKRPARTEDLVVRLNYGATGLGKSRYAYDNYGDDLYVIPITSSTLWFDGYDLQTVVLLDDFAGAASKVSLNYTLRLLDRYPQQVPVKGSFTWWMPNLLIITTNIHPRLWYNWDKREQQYSALLRRITEVYWYRTDAAPLGLVGDDRLNFDANKIDFIESRLRNQPEAVESPGSIMEEVKGDTQAMEIDSQGDLDEELFNYLDML